MLRPTTLALPGPLADAPAWLLVAIFTGVFLLVVVVSAVVRYHGTRDDGGDHPTTDHTPSLHAVTVEVVDDAGGRVPVDGTIEAVGREPARRRRARVARDTDDGDADDGDATSTRREHTTLSGGHATLQLPPGKWRLTVEAAGDTHERTLDVTGDHTISVPAAPAKLGVRCLDADTRDPVPDAAVTCRVNTGDDHAATTDDDGRATFELPRHATAADLTVDHDRYETATRLAKLDDELVAVEFDLQPAA